MQLKEVCPPDEMEVAVFTDDKQTEKATLEKSLKSARKSSLIMKNGLHIR